ncbi:MAG: MFS transporter [Bacteroidales bacterium]|nr:MFS transporter [Bacteroidales bacterium]
MSLFSFYRISKPSEAKVPPERVQATYKSLRAKTFWTTVIAYSLYYVCRMSLNVVKQPIIDDGLLTPGQLGLIGSAFLFVYAVGKFVNGFIADYCNIRRFMATGLLVSAVINLLLGVFGLINGRTSWIMTAIFAIFAVLWGINGWAQSMGSPPGIVNLSRWFPLSKRGTYYGIFSSTPYIGESLSLVVTGLIVGALGWQVSFVFSALCGLVGAVLVMFLVSDTPESKGLPSVQELSGEEPQKEDTMPTSKLQKMIFTHPGIWVIALSSAFVYITKYAVAGWGVLFLQKDKDFSLESATQIIAFSAVFGVVGTVLAGWLSDNVFKGDRIRPAIISGLLSFLTLAVFLFTGKNYWTNVICISVFSLAVGVLYCIVAGLMAVDIVPRKATGAALGIVGISSYAAAGLQDIASGYLIQGFTTAPAVTEGLSEAQILAATTYNFTPVSIFWLVAALLAFLLPVTMWRKLKARPKPDQDEPISKS